MLQYSGSCCSPILKPPLESLAFSSSQAVLVLPDVVGDVFGVVVFGVTLGVVLGVEVLVVVLVGGLVCALAMLGVFTTNGSATKITVNIVTLTPATIFWKVFIILSFLIFKHQH